MPKDWMEIAHYAMRSRADYSVSITHWTKAHQGQPAFEVLKKILNDRNIIASGREGFIKAGQRAVCFTETPVTAIARTFLIADKDADVRQHVKWEPYGLSFLKPVIYQNFNGRPVLYLSTEECEALCP